MQLFMNFLRQVQTFQIRISLEHYHCHNDTGGWVLTLKIQIDVYRLRLQMTLLLSVNSLESTVANPPLNDITVYFLLLLMRLSSL